jgi:hypothetical protein
MADRFAEDQRGAMVGKFAAAAAVIALIAVVGGTSIEQMASAGRLPSIAFLSPDQYVATRSKPNSVVDEIDYMATGSITGRVVLDPCTGRQRSP